MSNNMAMQTITAYKYKITNTKEKEPLVSGDGTNGTISICKLLEDFAAYMKRTHLSTYSQKVLTLEKSKETKSDVAEKCIHFKATSGRYGQRTVAIDINDDKSKTELGTTKAICHFYNVFFFVEYNTTENICIFHRYGRGGCKTVFLELFNRFLQKQDLRIEMTAMVSPEQESVLQKGRKTKIRLLKNTTKTPASTDITDNFALPKKMSNNTEMELTINLKNKKMAYKMDEINDFIFGKKTVGEIFEIPENFEYDQTKVEMFIGNQQRTVDLDYIGSMLCECDITHKLSYDKDNEPTYETISAEANSYYSIQKKKACIK